MFTGIVEERGSVSEAARLSSTEARAGVGAGPPGSGEGGDILRLEIHGPVVASDAKPGDSISVNGVCLTVVEVLTEDSSDAPVGFSAEVVAETLSRSTVGSLRAGDLVNLERAAALGQRLGGHIVQGHVDGVSQLLRREEQHTWFALPAELARYVVEKGSITVDGVSLTVAALREREFAVALIPSTLELTTLGSRQLGESVNLEVDVLAKHLERLTAAYSTADQQNGTHPIEGGPIEGRDPAAPGPAASRATRPDGSTDTRPEASTNTGQAIA